MFGDARGTNRTAPESLATFQHGYWERDFKWHTGKRRHPIAAPPRGSGANAVPFLDAPLFPPRVSPSNHFSWPEKESRKFGLLEHWTPTVASCIVTNLLLVQAALFPMKPDDNSPSVTGEEEAC